jgi:hypothetical protein
MNARHTGYNTGTKDRCLMIVEIPAGLYNTNLALMHLQPGGEEAVHHLDA